MSDFISDAMRTASDAYYGEKISKDVFISYLEQLKIIGEDLDRIKKTLFYGKPPTEYAECWDPTDINCAEDDWVKIETIHGILGVITEAAELGDQLINILSGEDVDVHNIHEESGDVKWYLAMLARARGDAWDADEKTVIAKLKARYPDKFTEEHAKNRDLAKERKIIESGGNT